MVIAIAYSRYLLIFRKKAGILKEYYMLNLENCCLQFSFPKSDFYLKSSFIIKVFPVYFQPSQNSYSDLFLVITGHKAAITHLLD